MINQSINQFQIFKVVYISDNITAVSNRKRLCKVQSEE